MGGDVYKRQVFPRSAALPEPVLAVIVNQSQKERIQPSSKSVTAVLLMK